MTVSSSIAFLSDGGELGERIRSFDWSKHPLGPPQGWPQSLRSAVSIFLQSRAQIVLFWGPDLTSFYNDAYTPVFGSKHPWALGKPARETWREIWDVLGPLLLGVLKTGKAFASKDHGFALVRHGYVEETYFDVSYDPVRVESGDVGGVFCIVSETTGRVIGERRLRMLRDLGNTVAEAKRAEAACELAATTLAGNPYDLPFTLLYLLDDTGRTAVLAGLSGLRRGARMAPETVELDETDAAWPFCRVWETGVAVEVELAGASGALEGGVWPESPERAVVLPMTKPGQSGIAGFVVAGLSPRLAFTEDYKGFIDLLAGHVATGVANSRAYEEERRRAETLAEIDRAKTRFFSNVSHEFRTPLTLLLGPLEETLANEHGVLPAGVAAELTVVHRNSLRLQKLVNTLLDFSRIEAGRVQAVYEPTDLAAFTAELASSFRSAIEKAGMRLVLDCQTLAEPVYVDRDMWEKIALNLLSNAFKYTFEGEVRVALFEREGAAVLEVSDTGIGIPEDVMPHLFERFYRFEGARGRTHEGSGIGLALVHELATLHEGSVRARSELGVGSTFTVTLPLGTAHLPADRIQAVRTLPSTAIGVRTYVEEGLRWLREPPSEPPLEPWSAPGQGEQCSEPVRRATILLADDNADMREYVRRLLGHEYLVEAASDGLEALRVARERAPDLVLTDVMMPGLDGFGLLRELRSDERLRTVPVIVLSARAGEEARVEGLDAGADDYLVKPFSAKELLACVRGHLAIARVRGETEARLREMIDALPAAVYTTDAEGRLTHFNPAAVEISGHVPQIGVDRWCVSWKLFRPDGRPLPHDECPMAVTLREGRAIRGEELVAERPDGTRVWLAPHPTPLRDDAGRIVGGINMLLDITSRKQAEGERQQLLDSERAARALAEHANRIKDEFLATLSHELRTPLNAILGWSHILKKDFGNAARVAEGVAVIERNARVQTQLISDLLDMSRIISGKMRLEMERVELPLVVESALDTVRPTADAKDVRIETAIEPIGDVVRGDAARLQQVVWNLLSNAVKFTPRGGRVRVALSRKDEHVELAVSDTGCGISPEFLTYVFDRFRQADASSTRQQGGLGLGLAIAKQLVELHGGGVKAMSEGAGKGATFVVELPLAGRRESGGLGGNPGASLGEGRDDARLDGTKVLVVDDEADARMLLGQLLQSWGAEVVVAGDADTALALIESARPDVIVSDVAMPKVDGFEFIGRARARGCTAPAIALTAYARVEDRARILRSGFQMHVTKPIEPAELLSTVAVVVDSLVKGPSS